MTLPTFEELLTPHGQAALDAATLLAPTDATFLAAFDKLRRRFDPDLAKAAIETVILRSKARGKFPDTERLYFEREALEQATPAAVAGHRAARLAAFATVLDLGCGLGADAIALARAGCCVIAVERDPLRAAMAAANFAALNLPIEVIAADALTMPQLEVDAVFCDPARRDNDTRHLLTDAYTPTPHEVIARFPQLPIVFKLAPGIARSDLARYDGEAEFVSLGGELKECTLWLGGLATVPRRATVLPRGATLVGDGVFAERELSEPKAWVVIPEVAVIRAGLEPQLAEQLGAAFLDSTQPFLTCGEPPATPLGQAFRFDALITGSVSKLTALLRERGVGRVTWRNFGSPRDVESVRKAVKLKGDEVRTVVLTRLSDAAAALVLHPLIISATSTT